MSRKRYSKEFKEQAVELVRLGKAVPEVAEELGIGSGNLYRWSAGIRGIGAGQPSAEETRMAGESAATEELRRLRKEIANLRLENDILKKAAVILGTKRQSKHTK